MADSAVREQDAPSSAGMLLNEAYNFVWPVAGVSTAHLGQIHRVWLQQQFTPPRDGSLGLWPRGMVQLENGACGVLAAVQAWMLACREQRDALVESEVAPAGASSNVDGCGIKPDFDGELCEALAALLWNIAATRQKYSMHASRGAKDISRRVILAVPRELLPQLPKEAQDCEIYADPDPPVPPKPAQETPQNAKETPTSSQSGEADASAQAPSSAPTTAEDPPIAAPTAVAWTCPACTTVNQPSYVICEACFSDRPPEAAPAPGAAAAAAGAGAAGVSPSTALVPVGDSAAPPPSIMQPDATPPGALGLMLTWTCPACTSENPPGTTVCSVCLTSRTGENSNVATAASSAGQSAVGTPVADYSGDEDAALAAALSASLNADTATDTAAGAAAGAGAGATASAPPAATYADFDFASVAPPPGREVQDPYRGVEGGEGGLSSALALLCITERSTLLAALAAVARPLFSAPSVHGAMTVAHRAAEGSLSAGMRATAVAMFGKRLAAVLTAGDAQAAEEACRTATAAGELSSHSGVALLVYAAVLTRGVANCREDTSRDRMFSTLVYADGTSEQALLNLLLCGVARNDVDDATWCDVTLRPPIGFLSAADGITVCNMWKRPQRSVWVTHAGNHYTVLASSTAGMTDVSDTRSAQRAAAAPAAAQEGPEGGPTASADGGGGGGGGGGGVEAAAVAATQDTAPVFQVEHFNGLHPPSADHAATRHAVFRVALWGDWGAATAADVGEEAGGDADARAAAAAAAKAAADELHVKKILTTRVAEGGSKDSGPWDFLVVCKKKGRLEGALLTGGVEGGPVTAPPYLGRWYCRDCMLPKAPNYAGYNLEGASVCSGCSKHISECGHAHWVPEADMPAARVKEWKRGNAPQVVQVLRTRWPALEADWALCGGVAPSMFG